MGLLVPELESGCCWGLFQGHLVATAADMGEDRSDGTRVLGLGLGVLSGEAFARAGNLEFGSVLFAELASYSGSGLGAGSTLGLIGGAFMPIKSETNAEAAPAARRRQADAASQRPRLQIGNFELPVMYPVTFLAPPPTGQPDAAPVMCFGVEGVM